MRCLFDIKMLFVFREISIPYIVLAVPGRVSNKTRNMVFLCDYPCETA